MHVKRRSGRALTSSSLVESLMPLLQSGLLRKFNLTQAHQRRIELISEQLVAQLEPL